MGNFTRDTFKINIEKLKHYVGVRLQQGVPILDADWNEMEDIRKHELQAFLKWFVGNGVPQGNEGFRITQIAGGGVGTIVLTSNKKIIDLSSIVIDLEASTAAEALGFGPDNYSASRLGSSPARLVGNLIEPFTLEEDMKLVMSIDGLDKEEVTFQASDFKDIRAAVSAEVVTAINNAVENFTASVGQGNDFIIKGGTADQPGRCLVEGWDVMIEGDIRYAEQPLYNNDTLAQEWGVDPLGPLSPPLSGERIDTVYLDVWEREVGAADDIDLVHPDIKLETCVRMKREWVVRLAEGLKEPTGLQDYLQVHNISCPGHVYYGIATITRNANEKTISNINDVRQTCLSLPGIKEYIDFKTMAAQVGAITAINNVENPGGNVDLVQKGGITIESDNNANRITIGETHSSLTGNPHGTTAVDVKALPESGGTVNGNVSVNGYVSSSILYFNGVNSDSGVPGQIFGIYQEAGPWNPPYPDLVIGYHTGIKIGGHYSWNGTRFYNDAPGRSGAIEIMSVGNGDNNTRVNYNLVVNGIVRIGNSQIYDNQINRYNNDDLYIGYSNTKNTILQCNSGNVGIGTANPLEKLHINGSVRGNIGGALRINTGYGYVDIGPLATGYSHFKTDQPVFYFNRGLMVDSGCMGSYNQDLQLQTGGTTRITVRNNNGNVGIGTPEPKEKLDVDGSIRGKSFWNVSQSFFVGGDGDKFYAVVFLDNDWGEGPAEFEIVRSSVHIDRIWWGAMNLTINWHATSWGNGAHFLELKYRCSQSTFVKDIKEYPYSPYLLVWLRGNTTYYYRSLNNRVVLYNIMGTDNQPCSFDPVRYTGYSTAVDAAYLPEQEDGIKAGTTIAGDFYAGNIYANNKLVPVGSSDYAEYFESKNGKEIKPGTSVVLEDAKIRSAEKNEIPIGVISASPGIVGGVHIEWPKKYLRDEFGNQIMEEYKEEIMVPKKEKVKKERQKVEKKKVKEKVKRTEIVKKKGKYYQVEVEETVERDIEEPVFKEVDLYDDVSKKKVGKHKIPVMETYEEEIDVVDEKGQPVMVGSGKFETKTRPKINPDYDEKKEFIPREKRPEWNCVGLLGQLPLRKGQPVAPTWIKIKDISKDVELWLVK